MVGIVARSVVDVMRAIGRLLVCTVQDCATTGRRRGQRRSCRSRHSTSWRTSRRLTVQQSGTCECDVGAEDLASDGFEGGRVVVVVIVVESTLACDFGAVVLAAGRPAADAGAIGLRETDRGRGSSDCGRRRWRGLARRRG